LPNLNTLQILSQTLSMLSAAIVNPNVTHLFCTGGLHFLRSLDNHCPAITKLSFSSFFRSHSVVTDMLNFLAMRPLVTTVCVEDEIVLEELKEMLPETMTVLKCKDIDIFERTYQYM